MPKILYECTICGIRYESLKVAERCEKDCNKQQSVYVICLNDLFVNTDDSDGDLVATLQRTSDGCEWEREDDIKEEFKLLPKSLQKICKIKEVKEYQEP